MSLAARNNRRKNHSSRIHNNYYAIDSPYTLSSLNAARISLISSLLHTERFSLLCSSSTFAVCIIFGGDRCNATISLLRVLSVRRVPADDADTSEKGCVSTQSNNTPQRTQWILYDSVYIVTFTTARCRWKQLRQLSRLINWHCQLKKHVQSIKSLLRLTHT